MKPESRISALNRSFRRSFRRKKDDTSEKKTASDKIEEEKKLLEELRILVNDVIQPYHDEDFFLRCLKSKDMNLKEAEKLVRLDVNFRRILRTDDFFSNQGLPKVMKYAVTGIIGYDKEGSLVRVTNIGQADLKGIIHSLSTIDILRMCLSFLLHDQEAMKEHNKKTGKNAKRFVQIVNLENLSASQLMYKPVFDTAMLLLKLVQEHFYDIIEAAYVVNAPTIFATIYKALRPVIQDDLHKRIKIYGHGDWKEVLLEHIDAGVLPAFLGGTRVDSNNDPKCPEILGYGGTIPEEYHYKSEDFINPDSPEVHAITVPAGSFVNIPIEVKDVGSIIKWHLNSKDNDIGIGVYFQPEANDEDKKGDGQQNGESSSKTNGVKDKGDKDKGDKEKNVMSKMEQLTPIVRSQCQIAPEVGYAVTWKSGIHVLHLDNSYSWMSPKQVYYKYEIVPPGEDFTDESKLTKALENL